MVPTRAREQQQSLYNESSKLFLLSMLCHFSHNLSQMHFLRNIFYATQVEADPLEKAGPTYLSRLSFFLDFLLRLTIRPL